MQARRLVALASLAIVIAGCATPPAVTTTAPSVQPPAMPDSGVIQVVASNLLSFNQSVVAPAVGLAADLYEPLIEVSPTGAIYVAGHVAGAVTTGTPAYVSNDDGATWRPLPMLGPAATPPPGQGSAPPPGDEGHIVAAEDGRAYMADISLAAFPVTGWCEDGANQCYHNPNAYDRAASSQASQTCGALQLNDRPWAAYANGTMLLVNNAGSGAVQVGVLPVPPPLPTGGPATWNMCASGGLTDGIPGVPALRADGRFAVPQHNGERTIVVTGSVHDILATETALAMNVTSHEGAEFGGGPNFSSATFDGLGNLYVASMNNTEDGDGQFMVAFSRDAGRTFSQVAYRTSGKVGFLYVDGTATSAGAIVSWIQDGESDARADVYVAHLVPEGEGMALRDASLVADEVVAPCGDVMGSSLGPDGRAYVVVHSTPSGCLGDPLATPLSVYVQAMGTPTVGLTL